MSIKIQGIEVEITGDYTKLQKAVAGAKATVREQAKGISDALNNAVNPTQVSNSINKLVANFGTLNRASAVSGKVFSKVNADLGEFAKHTGLTSKELGKLQSRMLQTSAANAQERALRNIGRSAGLTQREVAALGRQFGLTKAQIAAVNTSLGNVPKKFDGVNRSAAILSRTFLGLGAVLGGAMGVGALARISDEYTNINSKLKLVTDSTEEFNAVYAELFRMSQETGSTFATNAANFANLALALQGTNISSRELLQVFEDVNKSLVVAGASVQEVNSFMLQFKQALGANRLQGDEFRGMMESNSYWAIQFAKALDTDIKGLYEMKEAGELTTEVVLNAHKRMSESIASDFDGMQKTIGRATTELSNAWKDVFADADKAAGSSNSIAESISGIAKTVTENKPKILGLFEDVASWADRAARNVATWGKVFEQIGKNIDNWADSKKLYSLTADLEEAQRRLERLQKGTLGGLFKGSAEDIARAQREVEGLQRAINDLNNKPNFDKLTQSVSDYIAELDKSGESGKKAGEKVVAATVKTTSAIKTTEKELKALAKAGESVGEDLWIAFDKGAESARLAGIQIVGMMEEVGAAKFADTIIDETETATTASEKLWEDFAGNTGNIIENFVQDTIKGQFDSVGDMFQGLLDSMLDMLVNFIARAAANSLISSIFGGKAIGADALTLGTLFGGGDILTGGGIGKAISGTGIGALGAKVSGWFGGGSEIAASVGSGSMPLGGAALAGTQYSSFQAPASSGFSLGSASSWAGPAVGAAIAAGVVAGIVDHFSDTTSIAERLNSSGFGRNVEQVLTESLEPIPAALQPALKDFREAAYDVSEQTIVATSGLSTMAGEMRITAQQLNSTTGEWEGMHSALSGAEWAIRQMADGTNNLTAEYIASVAASNGVESATEALITKYLGVAEATAYLAKVSDSAAGNIASAAGKIQGAAFDATKSVGSAYYSRNINDHAEGGIFTKATLLNGGFDRVAEAGYPEAILPLHNGPDTLAIMDQKIDALRSSQQPIVINISGDGKGLEKFIRVIADDHRVKVNRSGVDPLQRVAYS